MSNLIESPDYSQELAEKIPINILNALIAYVDLGLPLGSFVTACLENNFVESAIRADYINENWLCDITVFIYHCLPSQCWGNHEKIKAWLSYKKESQNVET